MMKSLGELLAEEYGLPRGLEVTKVTQVDGGIILESTASREFVEFLMEEIRLDELAGKLLEEAAREVWKNPKWDCDNPTHCLLCHMSGKLDEIHKLAVEKLDAQHRTASQEPS